MTNRLIVHELAPPLRTEDDGTVRVGQARVTLDTVVGAYLEGCTAEEIVEQYASLHLADVHAVIAYYLTHREEVDAYLQARDSEAEALRREVKATCDQRGIRERLLSRQTARRANP
jgi:uncharacterized protein (DUF433 family)